MLLQKVLFGAGDDHDMVRIRMDDARPLVPYQIAFEIAKALRMGAKHAARFDKTPATFMREMDFEDFDKVIAHKGFRRSKLVPNFDKWGVQANPPLVGLFFDGTGCEFSYEDAAKLQHKIRRAARRAKAWAGDTSRHTSMLGNLTSAEEDDKLGLA